jgi:hypothetical protein|tara:strand:+ start:353 stop:472 length:120 start_codon:yes stop_codon:yes gene_type:complete
MKSKLEPKISVTFYLKKISLKAEKSERTKAHRSSSERSF